MIKNSRKSSHAPRKSLGYEFKQEQLLLSAIYAPFGDDGPLIKYSYERLEFLGDPSWGIVAASRSTASTRSTRVGHPHQVKARRGLEACPDGGEAWFRRHHRVRLSSDGHGQARPSFRARERLRGGRCPRSTLDGGIDAAVKFVRRTLIHVIARSGAAPKPQERPSGEAGVAASRRLTSRSKRRARCTTARSSPVVYAGDQGLACGTGRMKKEAESWVAKEHACARRRVLRAA